MKLLLTISAYLSFLYGAMALPDSIDYPRSFYERNIATSLEARSAMPWGASVPEREFRHFVLPVRVNNENLDTCRMVFYREIGPLVRDLSMYDAVIEVNHWCHERVTYTPSDERTSSPLATIRTAYGRCGEESTLLVAALRAVGIPARQVYTPRWAHTDDNHAWVEAWADGRWYFLGACEPEPVLNLGWFNAPASRGLLMHTRVFGAYDGPEEVISRTRCYTEIDVTSNYAPVATRIVRVVDSKGHPVPGARVTFRIYNYAEFYPVKQMRTDAHGLTSISSGCGDLVAWADNDNENENDNDNENSAYGFALCDMRLTDTITLVLDHRSGDRFSADMHIVPPVERTTAPLVTDEMRAANNVRVAHEDSLRNAYIATFPSTGNPCVLRARGNWRTISDFLSADFGDSYAPTLDRERFLMTLRDKDLRDITPDVLTSATFSPAPNRGYPDEIWYCYVLCPRVLNEMLTPFRDQFDRHISKSDRRRFRSQEAIIRWTADHIRIDEASNPQHLRMSPLGVYIHRTCDAVSRDIFFVALSRYMGFATRINPVNGRVERYEGGKWLPVRFSATGDTASEQQGLLRATYSPDRFTPDPGYYTHFTLSCLDGGRPVLLNYAEEDTWSSLLKEGAVVRSGDYLMTSGTRLADGSVLCHIEVFPVLPDAERTVPLVLPASTEGLQVIGSFNSENRYLDELTGPRSILSTTGRGYYVLGLIAPGSEPTVHTLRDIAAAAQSLEAIGRPLLLLFEDEAAMARFRRADLPPMPTCVHWGTDMDGRIFAEIGMNMRLSGHPLPWFVIADTFNRIVFLSEGYTIGLGDRLVHLLKDL